MMGLCGLASQNLLEKGGMMKNWYLGIQRRHKMSNLATTDLNLIKYVGKYLLIELLPLPKYLTIIFISQ